MYLERHIRIHSELSLEDVGQHDIENGNDFSWVLHQLLMEAIIIVLEVLAVEVNVCQTIFPALRRGLKTHVLCFAATPERA